MSRFGKKNNDDFYATNNEAYEEFCAVFLREPQRPKQILMAFWFKYDGYLARIKRIRNEYKEANRNSLASARELCKTAVGKMEAANKQHTRDIRYLMDNVS